MTQVTLNIPDGLVNNQKGNTEELAQWLQLATAINWYSHDEIPQGKAEQVTGMNRKDFLKRLTHEKNRCVSGRFR